jgi:Protein of unknown function (DUF2971)
VDGIPDGCGVSQERAMSSRVDRRPPSGLLYQYTDVHGLKGIMCSQKLWPTNIAYLNDSQEINYARMIANGVILQRAQTASDRDKEILTFLCHPEGISPEPPPFQMIPPVFVTSFSENGDLLSQWRGYCPNDDGYSIGFVGEKLYYESGMQQFGLARCLYEDKDQRKAIDGVLDEFMKSPSWIRALEHLGEDDSRSAVIGAWRDRFLPLAVTIKHPAFQEEREWRLMSTLIQVDDPRCRVRAGRSMLIPYVEYNLVEINPISPSKRLLSVQRHIQGWPCRRQAHCFTPKIFMFE